MAGIELVICNDLEARLKLIEAVKVELKALTFTAVEAPYAILSDSGSCLHFIQDDREINVVQNTNSFTVFRYKNDRGHDINYFNNAQLDQMAKHIVNFLFEEYLK